MLIEQEEFRRREVFYVAFKINAAGNFEENGPLPMMNAATMMIAAFDAIREFRAAYANDLPRFRQLLLESGQVDVEDHST